MAGFPNIRGSGVPLPDSWLGDSWFQWGSDPTGGPLPPPNTMTPPNDRVPAWERKGRGMATAQPTQQVMPPPDYSNEGIKRAEYGGVLPQDIPAEDPFTAQEAQQPSMYSFLDAPGASDALVAFGAAMLKAPDFNTGLGDAALAVNKVAQGYRMPTEQDYARARQLGMLERIKSGKSASAGSGQVEVNDKVPMYGKDNRLYFSATGPNGEFGVWDTVDQKFIAGGVPGLVRATDSQVGPWNRASTKTDADAEQQLYIDALAADDNLIQLENLKKIRPTAGVGLDAMTRVTAELVKLTGMPWDNIDPTSVSSLQASTRQLGLNWSQKMRGQGQVTEFERQQIVEMLPQALQDPQAFDNLVGLLEQVERRKKMLAQEWFKNPNNRQQYGSFRNFMLSRIDQMPVSAPTTGTAPPSSGGGGRKSLNDIFGN